MILEFSKRLLCATLILLPAVLSATHARGETQVSATQASDVYDYHRADYGELLTSAGAGVAVWTCDATRKIPPERALPAAQGDAACISAAKNDREAVQIIIRPKQPLQGLTATATELAGPDGATIPAENVKILRVYYHEVEHPTDSTGVKGRWPDALPPLDAPLDVAAGENQPLWVLVHVPEDAEGGDYAGSLHLQADGFRSTFR